MGNIAKWGLFILVTAWLAMGCRRQDCQDSNRDKDEEHSLVLAQELSNSRVQCIAEDASGQLWIGTFRGLNRYDGHEYHQYFCADDTMGLPDNQIKDILCDRKGRLWVATVNGICRYTRMDGFERIGAKTTNQNIQKLLEDRHGRVFAYNGIEVLLYDDGLKAFHPIISRQLVRQQWIWANAIIDAAGDILITESQRLLIYDGTSFKQKQEIPLDSHLNIYYSEMLSDGLMILSGYGQIILFDTKSRRMVPLDPAMEARLTAHNSIIQAARLLTNNTILLSTSKNGIFELNLLAKELKALPAKSGLVTQIFQDSRQNVWMGTYDKGLFADYYYKEKFGGSDNYLNRAIDHSSVLALAMDRQHNLWISTLLKGLFVYHCDSQQAEAIPLEGLPSRRMPSHISSAIATAISGSPRAAWH